MSELDRGAASRSSATNSASTLTSRPGHSLASSLGAGGSVSAGSGARAKLETSSGAEVRQQRQQQQQQQQGKHQQQQSILQTQERVSSGGQRQTGSQWAGDSSAASGQFSTSQRGPNAPLNTTSSSQRLGSIEILNENKQRQLQLEQQESFRHHLEERQRFIQLQHKQQRQQQQQSGAPNQPGSLQQQVGEPDLSSNPAYQVQASAMDYEEAFPGRRDKLATSQTRASVASRSGVAVNPFDSAQDELTGAELESSWRLGQTGGGAASKNGFKATLVDAEQAAWQAGSGAGNAKGAAERRGKQAGAGGEGAFEEERGVSGTEQDEGRAKGGSRYSKVAEANSCSYNYGDGPNEVPFYRKDLSAILQECRGSRRLVILIVAIALLLDNMLLTAVVPIIPAYLYRLRIEREHREALLKADQQLAANRSLVGPARVGNKGQSSGLFSRLDSDRNGRLDEEEIQTELERRINQSIAGARDRFSGSFFKPGVVRPQQQQQKQLLGEDEANEGDQEDEDEQEGDQDSYRDQLARSQAKGGRRRGGGARARKGGRSRKTHPSGQDDELEEGEAEGAAVRRVRAPPEPARRPLEGAADEPDEYEELESGDRKAGPEPSGNQASSSGAGQPEGGRRAASRGASGGPRLAQVARQQQAQEERRRPPNERKETPAGGQSRRKEDRDREEEEQEEEKGRGEDEEDDDEDAANSRRWSRLRSTLASSARKNGNDTDTLGSMCLRLAMGDWPQSAADEQAARRAPKTRPSSAAKSGQRASTQLDSEPDEDQDDEEQAGDQQASRAAAAGREPMGEKPGPRASRLRPGDSAGRRQQLNKIQKGPDSRWAAQDEARSTTSGPETAEKAQKEPWQLDDDELVINHQDIVDESFEVGVMFASKPIVQAIANPFIGAITNRVGFTLPMFLGFTIMFLSTLVFAFGSTYGTLFLARAIQGVGSACTSVAGMSMIAERFPDDAERGNAMAVALGGLALGVVIGPPFGGFMYEFFGKPSPFIVLAGLALMDGLLQLLVLQPRVSKSQEEGASLLTLINDPYILVAAGAITFANTGIGILEPALPLWMMDTMQAKNWEQGVAFLPAALSYLFSTNIFGNLGFRIGRWRSAMLGLIIIGCSLLLIPFATRVDHLILPNGAIGFAIGMVDSTMMPMLGYLVDIRHTSVYGSVYAIGDVAFCASFVFGPALSGTLVELIGFEGLIVTAALICFAFAPLLFMLRDPPARLVSESNEPDEMAQLRERTAMRYVNTNNLDSPEHEANLNTVSAIKNYEH